MNIKEALKFCENQLKKCGIETYKTDCVFLISYLAGIEVSLLPLHEKRKFHQINTLKKFINIRCKKRISVQHIIGEWDCLGRTFKIFKKVLAPRGSTEFLIELALDFIKNLSQTQEKLLGLEVGTGTGCISINLLKEIPNLFMVGVEIDPVAYDNTLYNARKHKVQNRLIMIEGDIFQLCPEDLQKIFKKFDFIISNPPYIAVEDKNKLPKEVLYENPLALFGGKKGIKFHTFLTTHCRKILKKGGYMFLEIAGFQKKILEEKLSFTGGWKQLNFYKDFGGEYRVLVLKS